MPSSLLGLEAYDALQSTNYGVLSAKVFLEYFRELKRVPDLAQVPLLDTTIAQLEEFISAGQDASNPDPQSPVVASPENQNPLIATPQNEVASLGHTVDGYQGGHNLAWRYVKVGLRTVWRVTKIVAVSALCLLIVAMVLLQVFLFLYDHWQGESKRGRGSAGGGLQTEKFFAFLNSVTWLPQQLWQGLVLIVTILFLALVFAGKWIGEQALANLPAVAVIASIGAVTLVVWVFGKERKAEFEPSETNPRPTTVSWVMGIVVLIAAAVYFIFVLPVNKLMAKFFPAKAEPPKTKPCPECLSDIPVEAKRCAHCAQPLPAA